MKNDSTPPATAEEREEMKIVLVTWRDSHRYTYQMEKDEEVSVTEIKTVGWLVSDNTNQVVLAQDDIEDDIRGVIVIPRENIISMDTTGEVVQ